MKAYIITRTFEVPTSFEDDLLITETVGCTLEKTKAEDWCDRAVKQEIYSDSQFNITEIEIDKLPDLPEEFDPWTGHTVRCGGGLYKVVACSPDPYIVFDDGSKHYGMTIVSIDGNSDNWMAVNDAQVELVEDKK